MERRTIPQVQCAFTVTLLCTAFIVAIVCMIVATIVIGNAFLVLASSFSAAVLIRGAMRWLSTAGIRPGMGKDRLALFLDPVTAPLPMAMLLRFLAGTRLDALRTEVGCPPDRIEMRLRAAGRWLLTTLLESHGISVDSVLDESSAVQTRPARSLSAQWDETIAEVETETGTEPAVLAGLVRGGREER